MPIRAVFIDKDGTLIRDVSYNVDPAGIELMPGALEALTSLARSGFAPVVVSNQPGVGLGYFTAGALAGVECRVRELLAAGGVRLLGCYFCPHAPAAPGGVAACGCRKPAPGLLLQAARDHDIDLAASWMVGDILDDVEAGRAAGCRTVLVDTGGETEWRRSPARTPHAIVNDLRDAARIIGFSADGMTHERWAL
ncbi:MAG: HAD family hydrolase [Acidobacteria bacterium]|nr:MAG: HAD family hydrolase [Acidobacteriota bacterium]